jgi:hypothetical protein
MPFAGMLNGMRHHFANLLSQSKQYFLHVAMGTTGLGFLAPLLIFLLTSIATLAVIAVVEGKDAMITHWKKNAAIATIVPLVIMFIVYGFIFGWSVVNVVYQGHQSLVEANAGLRSTISTQQDTIKVKDAQISQRRTPEEGQIEQLKTQLNATCYNPDRTLTKVQSDNLHDLLYALAQTYKHPTITIGSFEGDRESNNFAQELMDLFRLARWNVSSDSPIHRPKRMKPEDEPDWGNAEGLSIQQDYQPENPAALQVWQLEQEVPKQFSRANGPVIRPYIVGVVTANKIPAPSHVVLWVGYK